MSENITWHEGEVTYEDRSRVLDQPGLVVWLTGLSASGKSTIAVEVEKRLNQQGLATYRLDGDNIRHGLNSDLSFSPEDRKENIRRIAEVAALFQDAALITLASFISPYAADREFARQQVGAENFIEVYVQADVETCAQRDPKGLYEQAKQGEIENFTGISAPYETPQNPELIVDTVELSLAEAVDKTVEKINEKL